MIGRRAFAEACAGRGVAGAICACTAGAERAHAISNAANVTANARRAESKNPILIDPVPQAAV